MGENYMVSVERALQIIEEHSLPGKAVAIPLEKALGHVLYSDIHTPMDMPPFSQSAMDGYAIKIHAHTSYKVIGEIKAGDDQPFLLKKGEAVRIFTGAQVPDSADAVVMQEKVEAENGVIVLKEDISVGKNIRPQGEQLKKGEQALLKGIELTPAVLGFLAGMGSPLIDVFAKPKVGIVVTGNELVKVGNPLRAGQIYDSNSLMLQSALNQMGIQQDKITKAKDDYGDTYSTLDSALSQNDVLIINGGISVGDYDYTYKALQELNVETLFYKIRQKPGKPMFFGKKGNKLVFALPGNPSSALSCFYIYVYPVLRAIMGHKELGLRKIKSAVNLKISNTVGRARFLIAKYKYNGTVEILEKQSSAMLHSYTEANALVFIPETIGNIEKDGDVETLLLPIVN